MSKKINSHFAKMIHLLSDGQFHDGTTIGNKLQMTRAAVWKMIKKLEGYDMKIQSIKGKGYALVDPVILLSATKIKNMLPPYEFSLEVFETIPSTNTYLKSLPARDMVRICLSETQSEGRGRFNRAWHSPFAQNIYFSCRYPFQKDVSELAGLSQVVSLAVLKTLKNIGISNEISAKWPNDIIYQQKKLSGILIEIMAETHNVSDVVIGIGINVNMLHDNEDISQDWTSMRQILGKKLDRNVIVVELIQQLFSYLELFKQQGFQTLVQEWMEADHLINQFITLKHVDKKIQGTAIGINDQGHLMLRLKNGNIKTFSSGDTTIMKKKT